MTDDIHNQDKRQKISKLAGKAIRDRQLLWMLTDKVYGLMNEDLKQQRERIKN